MMWKNVQNVWERLTQKLSVKISCEKTKSRSGLYLSTIFISLILAGPIQSVKAGPALVFDMKSDLILYSEDADRLWHPASLTKLMTAYMVFEAIKAKQVTWDSLLVNSPTARAQPPSKIGLPANATLKLKKAVEILIVKSANDVAVMIAEKLGGSVDNFAAKMNATAKRLGMRSSRFYNPHGLPHSKQVTTARDMGVLARAIINDFPEHHNIFTLSSVKVGKRRMRSHNDMLRTYDGADGMKTGFICASGFNIVVSATRDDRRLIAVVLGARSTKSRRERATELLNHGFANVWWKSLFPVNFSGLSVGTELNKGPANMRPVVCNYRPRKVVRKKRKKKARTKKIVKKAVIKKKKVTKKKAVKKKVAKKTTKKKKTKKKN